MNNYSLMDKNVEVFLEGGWAFSGLVEYVSDDIIVLAGNGASQVLYRNKIVAAKILEEPIEIVVMAEYSDPTPVFASNAVVNEVESTQSNYYGSIIPEDMLEGEPDAIPVSFSMSMSDFKEPMEKEDKYGPSKKVRTNRKKNTK